MLLKRSWTDLFRGRAVSGLEKPNTTQGLEGKGDDSSSVIHQPPTPSWLVQTARATYVVSCLPLTCVFPCELRQEGCHLPYAIQASQIKWPDENILVLHGIREHGVYAFHVCVLTLAASSDLFMVGRPCGVRKRQPLWGEAGQLHHAVRAQGPAGQERRTVSFPSERVEELTSWHVIIESELWPGVREKEHDSLGGLRVPAFHLSSSRQDCGVPPVQPDLRVRMTHIQHWEPVAFSWSLNVHRSPGQGECRLNPICLPWRMSSQFKALHWLVRLELLRCLPTICCWQAVAACCAGLSRLPGERASAGLNLNKHDHQGEASQVKRNAA